MNVVLRGRRDARTIGPPVARFLVFGLIVVLGTSALTIRLFTLQVSGGAKFGDLARANGTVDQAIPSTRGLIYDSEGIPLVTNVATYAVKIRPADLPESQRSRVVYVLASILAMDQAEINIALDANPGSGYDLVRIAPAWTPGSPP